MWGKDAVVNKNNWIYSLNCVHTSCTSKNITVLGSRQVSDERILVQFVYTNHLDLGKEENNLKLVLQEVFDLYPHIKFIETGQLINPVGLWII